MHQKLKLFIKMAAISVVRIANNFILNEQEFIKRVHIDFFPRRNKHPIAHR